MTDFTMHWHWPQWTFASWLFLYFLLNTSKHGKPRIVESGEDKGQPQKYSGFVVLSQIALWLFLLIAGGFFA